MKTVKDIRIEFLTKSGIDIKQPNSVNFIIEKPKTKYVEYLENEILEWWTNWDKIEKLIKE